MKEVIKEKNNWEQDDYVKEQGWATMPFEAEPDSQVAYICTELIMEKS